MSFNPGNSSLNLDGAGLRIGIVAACYNRDRVDQLVELVGKELIRLGLKDEDIRLERVPGSMEIPFAASQLAKSSEYDALIGLGVVIAGDTNHHDVIGYTTATTLQQVSIETGVPVVNGILVVNSEHQAADRLGGKVDRGAEFAQAAVALAHLKG